MSLFTCSCPCLYAAFDYFIMSAILDFCGVELFFKVAFISILYLFFGTEAGGFNDLKGEILLSSGAFWIVFRCKYGFMGGRAVFVF